MFTIVESPTKVDTGIPDVVGTINVDRHTILLFPGQEMYICI